MRTKILFVVLASLTILSLAACSTPLATGAAPTSVLPVTRPAVPDTVPSQASEPPSREISVTGLGKVTLVPDIAYINVGVHTQSKDVTEAVTSNNTTTQKVKDALIKEGVADADIQTSNFSIYPQQSYSPEGEITGTTYSVDNTVSVTIHDLSKIGKFLGEAVKAGANNVYGIQFDLADRSKALSDARKAAVDDARSQAEELAKVAGVSLGDLKAISTYASESPIPNMYEGKGGMAMNASSNVPISAGNLIVTVNVNATYFIK